MRRFTRKDVNNTTMNNRGVDLSFWELSDPVPERSKKGRDTTVRTRL